MDRPGSEPMFERVFYQQIEDSLATRDDITARRVRGLVHFAGKATAVIGMRRAGKTTFMHQLRADRAGSGTPMRYLPMVTFEDERLADIDVVRLGALIDSYTEKLFGMGDSSSLAWFLDEVQVVPGWERLVRRLLDSRATEVFVSGSSAALLSREVATSLRGRAWQVPIFPFSFDEAIRHNGGTVPVDPVRLGRRERAQLQTSFNKWLMTGGFPEAQELDEAQRRRLLTDYVSVAILRDVIDRHNVNNVVGLRWMTRHLLANAASLFSVESFHRAMRAQGIAIARDTVHQLLAHLEDCFLVRTVWMESRSERQRMVNPRKAYPVDTGFISVFDRSGRRNIGHALETAVLVELQRRRCEVTYVRTPQNHEVDFLARAEDGSIELIQVCADASGETTASRELRALQEAGTMFPDAVKRLLTRSHRGLPVRISEGVEAQPAYEWMLAGGGLS